MFLCVEAILEYNRESVVDLGWKETEVKNEVAWLRGGTLIVLTLLQLLKYLLCTRKPLLPQAGSSL